MEQEQQGPRTIEEVLRLLLDQFQESKASQQQFQTQQLAFNESMAQKLENIESRLVVLEMKSRPSTPPGKAMDVEPRVAFTATPPASPVAEPAAVPDTPMFGPTGLPVTPAPGKPTGTERTSKPKRRETLHLRTLKDSEDHAKPPVVHGVMPKHDHITYAKPGVRRFRIFWEEVLIFEMLYGVKLPVCALIGIMVMEQLIATDPARLGNGKFMLLARDELYVLMQSQFRPGDRLEFITALTKNVDFEISASYRPTPEWFQPFYEALLTFIKRFIEVYEILVIGIEDDQILPRVDNKEGGLVHIFVGKIPFEYGVRIVRLMGATKWQDLRAFTNGFRAQVESSKNYSEAARRLRRTFGGTRYDAEDREQKFKRLQGLCALQSTLEESDEDLDEAVNAAAEDLSEEPDALLAALDHKQPQKKPAFDKEREPLVCINKLLRGVCNKPNCSYVHREDLVAQKRLEFRASLDKMIAGQKERGAPHRAVPQRAAAVEDAFTDRYDDDEEY